MISKEKMKQIRENPEAKERDLKTLFLVYNKNINQQHIKNNPKLQLIPKQNKLRQLQKHIKTTYTFRHKQI
jgi:hypothetical protein